MNSKPLSDAEYNEFWQNGYLICRGMFAREEITRLSETARRDAGLTAHAIERTDSAGGISKLALWNQPGDDLYGMFSRNEAMIEMVAQLLEDEPYHYHSKMMMKEPFVGGAWEWHQDYGYWYQNGVLTPNMCSVMIAVDAATKENGCLQVIQGSHNIGRINHHLTGDQAGADMERVTIALERMQLIYCECNPGDVIVFHSNTLHRSDMNRSEHPRWSMICAYNTKGNNPFINSHHPSYTPIDIVPRKAILAFRENASGDSDKSWLDPNRDPSARSLT